MCRLYTIFFLFLTPLYSISQDQVSVICFFAGNNLPKNYYPVEIYLNAVKISSLNRNDALQYSLKSHGNISVGVKYAAFKTISHHNFNVVQGQKYYFSISTGKEITEKKGIKTLNYCLSKSTLEEDNNNPIQPEISDVKGSGTCFLINKSGYFLTNFHVVDKSNKIYIKGKYNDSSIRLQATVIATDKLHDIALIKIQKDTALFNKSCFISLRNTVAEQGEKIYVLGYPLTNDLGDEIKLTDGLVSSCSGYRGENSQYQLSAPIQPGNSGSPLFDEKGNVMGIITSKIVGAENIAYATKSLNILQFLEQSAGFVTDENIPHDVSNLSLIEKVKKLKQNIFIVEIE